MLASLPGTQVAGPQETVAIFCKMPIVGPSAGVHRDLCFCQTEEEVVAQDGLWIRSTWTCVYVLLLLVGIILRNYSGTSLVVQRLRCCAPNAGGLGSILLETRSYMLPLRVHMWHTPHPATKTSIAKLEKQKSKELFSLPVSQLPHLQNGNKSHMLPLSD